MEWDKSCSMESRIFFHACLSRLFISFMDIFKSDLSRFFEGAKVAFSIFIESCKLIGNIYKTKFVCSLLVGIKYCQIAKSCLCHGLRAEEKDLVPAALVAGFTRRTLHRVMISVIHFSASESCLILAKMSSKQVNSPSFINTLNISSWRFNVLT